MTINIKPIEVSKLGTSKKVACQLVITNVNVNLVDDGVSGTFHLVNELGECVYNDGRFELDNDEILNWTITDEQLLDDILLKLELERA